MRPLPGSTVSRLAPGTAELEVRLSLALLAVVILIALTGLAAEGNWPKVLRIGLAFAAYALVLLVGARRWTRRHSGRPAPYWLFAAAGTSAGLVSGLARTTIRPAVVLIGALGGALLLSSVHWAALRRWRRVQAKL